MTYLRQAGLALALGLHLHSMSTGLALALALALAIVGLMFLQDVLLANPPHELFFVYGAT
jgi:hypothetical protein